MPIFAQQSDGSLLIAVKAVPGASRDQIGGVLGDRLKVRVAAPPEGGKANRAICTILAKALDRKPRDVVVAAGSGAPEKLIRVPDMTAADAASRLGVA